MIINSPTSGLGAEVSSENQFRTVAESHTLQHHNAWVNQNSFQVISVDTGITIKTQTLLHIINTDPNRKCVIAFIRTEAITDTANKPVVGEYFELGFGRTVDSGGTVAEPVNTTAGSGVAAAVTVTGIDPTMVGTFVQLDRKYNQSSASEWVLNKNGSIILGLNEALEMRFISAGAGEAKCRFTFMMIDNARG